MNNVQPATQVLYRLGFLREKTLGGLKLPAWSESICGWRCINKLQAGGTCAAFVPFYYSCSLKKSQIKYGVYFLSVIILTKAKKLMAPMSHLPFLSVRVETTANKKKCDFFFYYRIFKKVGLTSTS